jgi:peptidoglycan/LPS O-acetylase OafA/YrhL
VPLLQFFPLFFAGIIFYKWRSDPQGKHLYFWMLVVCLWTQSQLYGIASGRSGFFISPTQYYTALLLFFILFLLFVHNKLAYIVNKPLMFLGKISFALYLTHQYVLLQHVMPFLLNRLGINFWIAALFISVPVSLAIATAITYLIELPYSPKMKSWLMRKIDRGRVSENFIARPYNS